jgi:hypothetical protein
VSCPVQPVMPTPEGKHRANAAAPGPTWPVPPRFVKAAKGYRLRRSGEVKRLRRGRGLEGSGGYRFVCRGC